MRHSQCNLPGHPVGLYSDINVGTSGGGRVVRGFGIRCVLLDLLQSSSTRETPSWWGAAGHPFDS